MAHRRVLRDAPTSTLFSSRSRTAMRNARALQRRRASCAGSQSNAVCGVAAIDSVAPGSIIIASLKFAAGRGSAANDRRLESTLFAAARVVLSPAAHDAAPLGDRFRWPARLEIGGCLTKVR